MHGYSLVPRPSKAGNTCHVRDVDAKVDASDVVLSERHYYHIAAVNILRGG